MFRKPAPSTSMPDEEKAYEEYYVIKIFIFLSTCYSKNNLMIKDDKRGKGRKMHKNFLRTKL
jgi:hypothetical protein